MKIAITGSLGSGKSTCSQILKEMGYTIFNADEANNECLKAGSKTYLEIIDHFKDILDEEQNIDRKKLANIIFNDSTEKRVLESICHPAILEKMQQAVLSNKNDHFFAEIPLLFETEWDQYFDGSLLISISEEVRLQRCMSSRGFNQNEISERLNTQMKDELKRQKATWVIENNGSINELEQKIKQWLQKLLQNQHNS